MITAVIVLGVALVFAIVMFRRDMRALRVRIAALESRTDAAQRWQNEVRKALATAKR